MKMKSENFRRSGPKVMGPVENAMGLPVRVQSKIHNDTNLVGPHQSYKCWSVDHHGA